MSALPELTMVQMLREHARHAPDAVALRQKDFGIWNPITWAAYHDRARAFALGLLDAGLSDGGHLGILSENRVEWVLAQFAAGMAGGVAVGVYPTSPAAEVSYVLGHADAEIVVCEDQEQTDKVLECLDDLPRLKCIVVIDMKGLRHYRRDIIRSFAEIEALGAARDPAEIDRRIDRQGLDDTALIIYTSGSTGRPKGAMISWGNMRAEAAAIIERLGSGPETTHLSYLPLCHVAEQMFTTMAPLYARGTVNFGESLRTVQEDLREVAPTSFLGVPRIWEKLHASIHVKLLEAGGYRKALFEHALRVCAPFAEIPRERRTLGQRLTFAFYYLLIFRALQNFIGLRRARVALTGAAPIPRGIVAFFRTIGVPLLEVYGQTETTGMITGQYPGKIVVGAVGPAVEGAEIRIGEMGELLLRGPLVFKGYYKNEEATRATLRDGWLHTGDVADIAGEQYRIVDRLKDIMITAGGKNLSPSEIENTVKGSPFIKECIVIGEGRKYVSALIQVDLDTVGKWAEEKGLAYTNYRSLAENQAVRDLIGTEIGKANDTLAQVAHIRRFHLLTKELDHDDDEVTATMKVRRANIAEKYAEEIAALYA
ncbi:AMP-binding protein [Marivibrio halodurans]|uniref:AMP-binding protein n=1 Tax=Marivibrio halodurans TaxID=2039722 RepID=A0A8J7V170_9PROT|nr:AMP-binding protein [Marivibrio halodurans]MBP5856005.1 AMP-binding protein [Marivibrio halodurans]